MGTWCTDPNVGSLVAGCIGAHLARGKVKSVEHALSWSLDSKQLPITFTSMHMWQPETTLGYFTQAIQVSDA